MTSRPRSHRLASRACSALVALGTLASIGSGRAGAAPSVVHPLDLGSLTGANGMRLSGEAADDRTGWSVSGAGDVNNDGFDDVIVGDRTFFDRPGAAYVVLGRAGGLPANLDLASLAAGDGSAGFKLTGAVDDDTTGYTVAGAGDVNGDGFDDVVVGAPGFDVAGNKFQAGAAYVVFGRASFAGAGSIAPASLDGTTGFRILGAAEGDSAGWSVSGAGDVNGDGFDDVLVGAFLSAANGTDSGAVYVVFGKASGFTATTALSGSMGAAGLRLAGAAGARAGRSVAGADLNGDGFADVVVGEEADGDGRVGVVFGRASGLGNLTLSGLNGTNGFAFLPDSANDAFGGSVARAGDLNGDGVDDLIVGARFAGQPGFDVGAAYVLYGKKSAFTATIASAGLDGSNGFRIDGDAQDDTAGTSVSAAGDVNGDGADDVLVGAPGASPHGSSSGAAYVVLGVTGGGGGLPVTIAKNGRKATFTDTDGDLVTVTTNKGAFTQAHFSVAAAGSKGGGQLQRLRLSGTPGFAGAKISVRAKPGPSGGDAMVHVGAIDAAGLDLGGVTVKGDLGRIAAGDAASPKPALKKVVVQSLGAFGLTTQTPQGASLASELVGDVKALTVKSDVARASVKVTGNLGKLGVAHDIVGGDDESSGLIDVAGGIKSVRVRGSLRGGKGDYSGSIFAGGTIGSAVVGGSLVGAAGLESGTLETRAGAGKIAIGGDVQGGAADSSGSVICLGPLKNLRVKGSVTGGGGEWSGSIYVASGNGAIKSLRVDGSIVGGASPLTGVVAGATIGKLSAGKGLRGTAAAPVRIFAAGVTSPATAAAAITIGSVKIGGNVEFAQILAGWGADATPVNADAQIGKVAVTRDWIASTLVAGVDPVSGGVGDADDRVIGNGGLPAVRSRIASVAVKGAVSGTAAAGDHFGFVAEEIAAFRVGSRKLALTKGAGNDDTAASDPDFLLGADGDVRVRELAGN